MTPTPTAPTRAEIDNIQEALEYTRRVLLGAENTCTQNLPERSSSRKRALKKIEDTQRIFGTIEEVLIQAAKSGGARFTRGETFKHVRDYFWKNAKEHYPGEKHERQADYCVRNTIDALIELGVVGVKP